MKLKGKILALSLVPVIALGTIMFLVAADRIAEGIYDEAYVGMKATALAVRDIFEQGNSGAYHLDAAGELWKGDSLNISRAWAITDHIKENTGMEATIFWGDKRVLTSIVNERGERQINTTASSEVAEHVLENGETYLNRNVEILGRNYIVCYIPFYQDQSDEIVGMVFLGTPQETVSAIINKVKGQLLLIILCMALFVTVSASAMVIRVVSALKKNMSTLDSISKGQLHIQIGPDVLRRKDEIGDLGRNIVNLGEKLRAIVTNIHEKASALGDEAGRIEHISEAMYQVMQDVDSSAREMAASCHAQADDADHASANVTAMGDMIGENTSQIRRMHQISGQVRDGAAKAAEQFSQLDAVMHSVQEAASFLAQQTALTGESVARISSATELITAIASRTNLLSLNASIEAARAGDLGRGFAVVASQIQQLSEQSNQAASEIKRMVESLNADSGRTLERVKEVQDILENQEDAIRQTRGIFREVCGGVDSSASGMDRIMEKSAGLEEIRVDTVAIVANSAALSQETSSSIGEVMASIEHVCQELGDISGKTKFLSRLSREMTASVDVFRLEEQT